MTQTKSTKQTVSDHKHVPGYMGVCQRCGLEKEAHVREAPSAPTQKSETGQKESTPCPQWWLNDKQLIQIVPRVDTIEIWSHDEPNWIAQVATKQHAELIVRAVNSHEKLLEACSEAETAIQLADPENEHPFSQQVLSKIRAAILRAEGHQ